MADYRQQLGQKLEAAQKRLRQGKSVKALKSEAPALFETIDLEISMKLNEMTQNEPLSYDKYLSTHGKILGLMRARDLMNSTEAEVEVAQQEITGIQQTLQQIEDDKKR